MATFSPHPALSAHEALGGTTTMTPETVGPLSRLVDVRNVPPAGRHVHVHATPEECDALAKDFGLAGIEVDDGNCLLPQDV